MSITIPTPSTLRKAAAVKEKIEALELQLEAILNGGEISAPVATVVAAQPIKRKRGRPVKLPTAPLEKKARRKISAAGRAAMAAAAKARWAKAKAV